MRWRVITVRRELSDEAWCLGDQLVQLRAAVDEAAARATASQAEIVALKEEQRNAKA
jgi:hypothetical protein